MSSSDSTLWEVWIFGRPFPDMGSKPPDLSMDADFLGDVFAWEDAYEGLSALDSEPLDSNQDNLNASVAQDAPALPETDNEIDHQQTIHVHAEGGSVHQSFDSDQVLPVHLENPGSFLGEVQSFDLDQVLPVHLENPGSFVGEVGTQDVLSDAAASSVDNKPPSVDFASVGGPVAEAGGEGYDFLAPQEVEEMRSIVQEGTVDEVSLSQVVFEGRPLPREILDLERAERKKWKGKRDKQTYANFVKHFRALVKYSEEHGDCNVPQDYEPNKSLGTFVSKYRTYKRSHEKGERSLITPGMILALDHISFDWGFEKGDANWNGRYDELMQYKNEQGHCKVPTKRKRLGRWVSTQRDEYTKLQRGDSSTLNAEKVRLLNEIGFIWRVEDQERARRTASL